MARDPDHDLSLPPEALEELAARASFLHERLARARQAGLPARPDASMPELVSRWRGVLGADRPGALERRLAWDGRGAGVDLRPRAAAAAAGWTAILSRALAACPEVGRAIAGREPAQTYAFLDPGAPVAFEHALIPFVLTGRVELARAGGAEVFSGPSRAILERALLQILSQLSLSALELEFSLFRAREGELPGLGGGPSNRLYRRFVARMLDGGIADFLTEYAVLARLLATGVGDWARAHAELAARLRRDWTALAPLVGGGDVRPVIEAIAPYRSDPHAGGRSVTLFRLPPGRWLAYKPRGMAMEEAFGELLEWVNGRGFSQPFRIVGVLDRGSYGWMEYAAPAPCRNVAEVERFYRRVGGHLCLLYFLQGTDGHHENLVASGAQPVLVDVETLMQPRMTPGRRHALGPGARRHGSGDDFALEETGLLPTPAGAAGAGVDFSALGVTGRRDTPFRVISCDGVNTDAMTLAPKPYQVAAGANVPVLDGRAAAAGEHAEAIVAGFSEMFRLVLRHRPELAAENGPLKRFAGRRGRVIIRSTNAYGLLQQEALQPDLLRDGAARGLVFETLRRAAVRAAERPDVWPLFDAELRALERMDIPYLAAPCDATGPDLERDQPTALWPPPLGEVLERLAGATEADLEQHAATIRYALSQRPLPQPRAV